MSSETLIYLKRATLRVLATTAPGEDHLIHRFPTPDVFAAPGASWLAYISPTGPTLNLLDPDTDQRRRLGRGVSPLWDPGGARLAFLEPDEGACRDEGCVPEGRVVVYDAATRERRIVLEEGGWGLLGWSGQRIIVFDARTLQVFAAALDGTTERLGLRPNELWDASPDGRWLVRVTPRRTEFVALERAAAPRPIEIPLAAGERLAEGAWSHDSSRVAAVLLRGGRSDLVVFSPGDPQPQPVPGTSDASGNVVWSSSNDEVAFARVAPGARGRLQASLCSLDPGPSCRSLFSWRHGVTLLELE